MGKKMFVLIVALMSFSLIGIVTVQVFWINNAVEAKKKQFKNDVKKSLVRVSEEVADKEYDDYFIKIKPLLENSTKIDANLLRNFMFKEIDTTGKQVTSYSLSLLEQLIKVPTDFLANDSLVFIKKITGREDMFKSSLANTNSDFLGNKGTETFTSIRRYPQQEELYIKNAYNLVKSTLPIHKRISNRELNLTLKNEFSKRGIDIDFKDGVYSVDG